MLSSAVEGKESLRDDGRLDTSAVTPDWATKPSIEASIAPRKNSSDLEEAAAAAAAAGDSRSESNGTPRPHSTSAKNLPWQKHFKLRIAPVCLKIVDEKPSFVLNLVSELTLLQHNGRLDQHQQQWLGTFKEPVVIMGVLDANRPPRELEYNAITIAIQCSPTSPFLLAKANSLSGSELDGLHLVREISSFTLAAGKSCITERLFMDKTRPLYKAKGWGMGNWRVWLALEDVDALRKKRKKTPVESASASSSSTAGGKRRSVKSEPQQHSATELTRQKRNKESSPVEPTGVPFASNMVMPPSTGPAPAPLPMYSPTSVMMSSPHLRTLFMPTGRQTSMPSMLAPPPPPMTRSSSNGFPFPSVPPQPQYLYHHPQSSPTGNVLNPAAQSQISMQGGWNAAPPHSHPGLFLPSHLLGLGQMQSSQGQLSNTPPIPGFNGGMPPHLWPGDNTKL